MPKNNTPSYTTGALLVPNRSCGPNKQYLSRWSIEIINSSTQGDLSYLVIRAYAERGVLFFYSYSWCRRQGVETVKWSSSKITTKWELKNKKKKEREGWCTGPEPVTLSTQYENHTARRCDKPERSCAGVWKQIPMLERRWSRNITACRRKIQ